MTDQPAEQKSVRNFGMFLNTIANFLVHHGFDDTNALMVKKGERFTYDVQFNGSKETGFHDDAPIRLKIRIVDTSLSEEADPYLIYQLLPSFSKSYSIDNTNIRESMLHALTYLKEIFIPLIEKLESKDLTEYQKEWEQYGFYGKDKGSEYPWQTNFFVMESLFGHDSAERTLSNYYQSLSPENQGTFKDAYFGAIAFPSHPDDKGWHPDTVNITYALLKQARFLDLELKGITPPELPNTSPVIELDDEGIIIDGKALIYPITMADLVETLGEPRREVFDDKSGPLDSYVWDDLGLTALASDKNSDYVGQFTILIESEGPKSFDSTPHHSKLSFPGSLRIGVKDYRQAIFIDIHAKEDFADTMLGDEVFVMARFNKDLTDRHITRVVVSYLNIPEKKFRFFKKK